MNLNKGSVGSLAEAGSWAPYAHTNCRGSVIMQTGSRLGSQRAASTEGRVMERVSARIRWPLLVDQYATWRWCFRPPHSSSTITFLCARSGGPSVPTNASSTEPKAKTAIHCNKRDTPNKYYSLHLVSISRPRAYIQLQGHCVAKVLVALTLAS